MTTTDYYYGRPSAGPGSAWYMGAPPTTAGNAVTASGRTSAGGGAPSSWEQVTNMVLPSVTPTTYEATPYPRATLHGSPVKLTGVTGSGQLWVDEIKVYVDYVDNVGAAHHDYLAFDRKANTASLFFCSSANGPTATMGSLSLPVDVAYILGVSVRVTGGDSGFGSASGFTSLTIDRQAASGVGPNSGIDAIPTTTLQIVQSVSPLPILLGENATITLTVTNTGAETATNVTISCEPGAAFPATGSWSGSMTLATLASGASVVRTRQVIGSSVGTYTSPASASADNAETVHDNESVSVASAGPTTLTVAHTITNGALLVGQTSHVDVTVTNVGSHPASNVYVVIGSSPSYDDNNTWPTLGRPTLGPYNIGVGQSLYLEGTRTAVAPAVLTSLVTVNSDNAPTVQATAPLTITTNLATTLSLTRVVNADDPIRVGDNVEVVLTVTNTGTAAALNVVIAEDFPAGFSYATGAPGYGWIREDAYPVEPGKQPWEFSSIPAGGSRTIRTTQIARMPGEFVKTSNAVASNAARVYASTTTVVQAAPAGTPDLDVQMLWRTADRGQFLRIGVFISNPETTGSISREVRFSPPAGVPETYWRLRGWGTVTPTYYRGGDVAGPVAETVTLAAGASVLFEIDVRVGFTAEYGSRIPLTVEINGASATVEGFVRPDAIGIPRTIIDPSRFLEMFLGVSNGRAESFLSQEGWDFLNEGGTLWDLVADLMIRRGQARSWDMNLTAFGDRPTFWS